MINKNAARLQKALSDALGYEVDLKPKRLSKRDRLEKNILDLQSRQRERITRGRTKGAGAGGFNRDIENIVHQMRLIQLELNELPD